MKALMKKFVRFLGTLLLPLFRKRSTLSEQMARQLLTDCSPKPPSKALADKNILLPCTCDLQIIIPAYNVEAYLDTCMQSVLSQQTHYTYHVVLIDDGSTDSTAQIADCYRENKNVTVIHQKNKGFSGARNTGLKNIFGKYIMFLDSDDALCPGAINALLETAFAHDCDIVEGGAYHFSNADKGVHFKHEENQQVSNALGVLHGQPWAKVFKARCLENLSFPEGFWFEDSIFSFLVYPVAKTVCVIEQMVYMYRQNQSGITATFSGRPKSIDSYWITEALMAERASIGLKNDSRFLTKFFKQLILNYKRISGMPENLQESAFVLSCALMQQHFSSQVFSASRCPLKQILLKKDWGAYKLYCKTH